MGCWHPVLEPREIEAALHDGVQQDLAAAAVSVQLAVQLLDTDLDAARTLLLELEAQMEGALERVRVLAEAIFPSALRALPRYSVEIEEAVYFACRVLGGSVRAWEDDGTLRFEVAGSFDDAAVGEARTRIERVGGQVAVSPGGLGAAVPVSSSAR
jgi:hypothetical protein